MHKFQALKARFSAYELFWQRNLVMIERGTHPKFKFRANIKDRQRANAEEAARQEQAARQKDERARKEERAFRALYDSYVDARRQCGQSTEVDYDAVRQALKKQVSAIKEKTGCRTVKFRISVEEGKAKVKAVPVT